MAAGDHDGGVMVPPVGIIRYQLPTAIMDCDWLWIQVCCELLDYALHQII